MPASASRGEQTGGSFLLMCARHVTTPVPPGTHASSERKKIDATIRRCNRRPDSQPPHSPDSRGQVRRGTRSEAPRQTPRSPDRGAAGSSFIRGGVTRCTTRGWGGYHRQGRRMNDIPGIERRTKIVCTIGPATSSRWRSRRSRPDAGTHPYPFIVSAKRTGVAEELLDRDRLVRGLRTLRGRRRVCPAATPIMLGFGAHHEIRGDL
jgi:hypothetical protein